MKRVLFTALLSTPLLLSAGPASAASILFNGEIGQNVRIYGPGTLAGSGFDTIAGAARASTDGGLSWFDAYCVDLQHYINPNGSFGYTLDTMSNWGGAGTGVTGPNTVVPQAWQQASWLYTNYSSVAASSGAYYRAALQMSIWEVLYDTGNYNILSLGDTEGFRVTGVSTLASNAASTMLNALKGVAPASILGYDASWYRTADGNPNRYYTQDFMANGSYTPPPSVPEPSSIVLLGTGIVGVLAAQRMRRRRSAKS